ncbi:MAG: DUF4352 domain-containing protein [Chloroflexota bacterium]
MKRVLMWTGIGCGGLILLLVLVGIFAGSSTQIDKATPTPVPGIGSAVIAANWEVSVSKSPSRVSSLSNRFSSTSTDGQFVLVPIHIRNVGKDSSTFSDSQLKIKDSQGREYDAAPYSVQSLVDGGLFLEQINPGLSHETTVVFELPKDATGLVLLVQGRMLSKTSMIKLEP